MLTGLGYLFKEGLALEPEMWTIICFAVVGAVFLFTLVIGLLAGDYKKSKSLMKRVIASPSTAVASMKQMPASVKQQYKRARIAGVKPSDYVSEDVCVKTLYKRSLISKVWLTTLIATVICTMVAFFVMPIAVEILEANIQAGTTNPDDGAVAAYAQWVAPLFVAIAGGVLTLLGGIISKLSLSGGVKTYAKFVTALDGDSKGGGAAQQAAQAQAAQAQAAQAQAQTAQAAGGFAFDAQSDAEPVAEAYQAEESPMETPVYGEPMGGYEDVKSDFSAEPVNDFGAQDSFEPVQSAPYDDFAQPAQPVYDEPVMSPVVDTPMETDEDIRRRAREEALAQARAAQEAEQARAAAAQAQAEAAAKAEAEKQAQAAAAAQAAAQAAAAAQAQNAAAGAGSSSADEVIARIEQIDREGASREVMREVATQLQKERAKPENKTPEQQKKLNEALSKLLKAMSAANRK